MSLALVIAIIGVATVLAQLDHCISAFNYLGCSSVDVSCFGEPIVFSDGRLTPEACQAACLSHNFAALFPEYSRSAQPMVNMLLTNSQCLPLR